MIFVDTLDNANLDTLLRFVAPEIPEIPYEVSLDMLKQAYIMFARKTTLLGAHIHLPIQKEVKTYELDIPKGYEVYSIQSIEDCRVFARTEWIQPTPNYWFTGWGYRFRMLGNKTIEFYDSPTKDDSNRHLTVRVIPTECISTIPRALSLPFGRGIAMGAVADMLEIPNRAWTNPRLASTKRLTFNRALADAKALAITDHGARAVDFRPVRIL